MRISDWSSDVCSSDLYAVAGVGLLAVCLVSGQDLTGYDRDTWLAIGGLVLGAQLLGHTLVNRVLSTISPMAVSVAILFEILGATVIARIAFGETPPAGTWAAAVPFAPGGGLERPRGGDTWWG